MPTTSKNMPRASGPSGADPKQMKRKQAARKPVPRRRASAARRIRYAVIGQGYISQIAMLPAFAHAKKNSTLVALISDDPAKLKKLAKDYDVPWIGGYDDYDGLLACGEIDAVYIALPNHLHLDYTVRAAEAGIHVLCEKPMAVSESECIRMIAACEQNHVKLMIAYRLHFEKATLTAIKIASSQRLGDPCVFNSVFTQNVIDAGNYRLDRDAGGGPLFDIGIYCINAARTLFGAEPTEVYASTTTPHPDRFTEVEETVSAIMRFPDERVAVFTSSFGTEHTSAYDLLGTEGRLRLDPAYALAGDLKLSVTAKGRTRQRVFKKRDQFAPQLLYFSDCILHDREPEPSGREGLNDVRIIEALQRSASTGTLVRLPVSAPDPQPTLRQETHRPAVHKPALFHASKPSA